jgi:hypothetical protein
VLKELPNQVIEYMTNNGIKPENKLKSGLSISLESFKAKKGDLDTERRREEGVDHMV